MSSALFKPRLCAEDTALSLTPASEVRCTILTAFNASTYTNANMGENGMGDIEIPISSDGHYRASVGTEDPDQLFVRARAAWARARAETRARTRARTRYSEVTAHTRGSHARPPTALGTSANAWQAQTSCRSPKLTLCTCASMDTILLDVLCFATFGNSRNCARGASRWRRYR